MQWIITTYTLCHPFTIVKILFFFFVSLLDGLVLGGGHIGENEYIQLLLLLEKGIKSIP